MADARDFKQVTVWAADATAVSGTPPAPAQGTAYRDTANTLAAGFGFLTKNPSELANQALWLLSKSLDQIQTHGTLGWNSTTAYTLSALAFGSNNVTYMSQQANNTNHDPVTDDGTWWVAVRDVPLDVSKVENGWASIGSGIQIRWGKIYANGTRYQHNAQYTQAFGKAFTNACLTVIMCQHTPTTAEITEHGIPTPISWNASGVTWWPQNDDVLGATYIAIGW